VPPGDGTYVDGSGNSQYVVSADQLTVTDSITGLVWQRDGSGARTGCSHDDVGDPGNTSCTWAEATTYCTGLSVGGFSGWRVPSLKELSTIMDYTQYFPVIDPVAFPNTEPWYFWASSPTIAPIYAWVVNFQGGGWYQAGANNYERVRCVR
jgi:hypothetical protein